jgi:hypothetical protein
MVVIQIFGANTGASGRRLWSPARMTADDTTAWLLGLEGIALLRAVAGDRADLTRARSRSRVGAGMLSASDPVPPQS